MKYLIVILLTFSLLNVATPFATADTTQSLEWGVETGDRFNYIFNYWVIDDDVSYTDEEFFFEMNITDLAIPDPLTSWESIPYIPHVEAWVNGSEADLIRIVSIYSWSILVPVGNWTLLSEITENRTTFQPYIDGPIEANIEVDDWFRWGFNYTFFNDEWDYQIHVSFTKSTGALASFSLIAYTRTTGEIYGYISAIRDGTPPFSFHPSDTTIESGEDGEQISWEVYDDSETGYVVYRNGSSVQNGTWLGGSYFINVSLDGLDIGFYEYRLELTDAGGNSTEDIVVVTVVDTTLPTIIPSEDLSYEEGTTGHVILWTASDLHPASYTILLDGAILETGEWDGGPITINVDGLTMGVYTYSVIVTDSSGNSVQDDVVVNVSISTTTLMFLGGGAAIVIAGAVVVRRRKFSGPYNPQEFDFHY